MIKLEKITGLLWKTILNSIGSFCQVETGFLGRKRGLRFSADLDQPKCEKQVLCSHIKVRLPQSQDLPPNYRKHFSKSRFDHRVLRLHFFLNEFGKCILALMSKGFVRKMVAGSLVWLKCPHRIVQSKSVLKLAPELIYKRSQWSIKRIFVTEREIL